MKDTTAQIDDPAIEHGDTRAFEKIALHALDIATGGGASYADVRVIDSNWQSIETKNMAVAAVNMGTSQGIGIRALVNGGWGFSSTQGSVGKRRGAGSQAGRCRGQGKLALSGKTDGAS